MKRLDGKVECDFCHKFATLENAGKMGWDWFTGYNTLTTHICAQCLKKKPGDAKRLFDLSRMKPAPNVELTGAASAASSDRRERG